MMCGITGTPGTGKSTVADELARRGHTVVHISDIMQPYVLVNDPERDTQMIDTDRMVDEFVPVDGFVEGHFAHLLPCDRIVVLRCGLTNWPPGSRTAGTLRRRSGRTWMPKRWMSA